MSIASEASSVSIDQRSGTLDLHSTSSFVSSFISPISSSCHIAIGAIWITWRFDMRIFVRFPMQCSTKAMRSCNTTFILIGIIKAISSRPHFKKWTSKPISPNKQKKTENRWSFRQTFSFELIFEWLNRMLSKELFGSNYSIQVTSKRDSNIFNRSLMNI